jgi:hypothetical protein
VARFDGAEVAPIKGDHGVGAEAFGECDDGGVSSAEWEVGVLLDELGDPVEVFAGGTFDVERPDAGQEGGLGCGAEATADEVRRLSHDEGRDDESQVAAREHAAAGFVVVVVGVCGCVQGARFNDRQQPRPIPV